MLEPAWEEPPGRAVNTQLDLLSYVLTPEESVARDLPHPLERADRFSVLEGGGWVQIRTSLIDQVRQRLIEKPQMATAFHGGDRPEWKIQTEDQYLRLADYGDVIVPYAHFDGKTTAVGVQMGFRKVERFLKEWLLAEPDTRARSPSQQQWLEAKANYYLRIMNRLLSASIRDRNPALKPMYRAEIARLHELRNEVLKQINVGGDNADQ